MDKLLPDDIFGPSTAKPKSAPATKKPAPKPAPAKKPIETKAAKAKPVAKPAPAPKPKIEAPKKPIKAAAPKKPAPKPPAKVKAEKPKLDKPKAKVEAKAKAKPMPKPKLVAVAKPTKAAKPAGKAAPPAPPKVEAKPKPAPAKPSPKTKAPAKPKKAPTKKIEPVVPPPIAAKPGEASGETDRRKLIEEFLKARKTSIPEPVELEEDDSLSTPDEIEDELAALGRMIGGEDLLDEGGEVSCEGEISDHDYLFCPVCRAHLPENATTCPHCYVPVMLCPYCGRRSGGIENPKMVTEQRFNRILKQFTLFGFALPSMPIQPILDCSKCKSRVIVCESCSAALKHSATACPVCNEEVRRTKMLINPLTILESISKKPDALKGIQKVIDLLLASLMK